MKQSKYSENTINVQRRDGISDIRYQCTAIVILNSITSSNTSCFSKEIYILVRNFFDVLCIRKKNLFVDVQYPYIYVE